jgi:uncharacterized protein with FMN-binding domain
MDRKKKRRRIILIAAAAVIVIGIAAAVIIAGTVSAFDSYMENLTIDEVDLQSVADGVYRGEADGTVIKVAVEVEVKDHQIIRIDILEHRNGKGEDAEQITDRMVEEQKILVDNVSGATLSSRVIKMAIENALSPGMAEINENRR